MTEPTDYRRFDLASTGTRPTLKLGDPGIDVVWLRRHRLGQIVAAGWCTFTPVVLGIGFLSAWGPFGRFDTWQLDTFGSNNVILLTILFMPLAFAPFVLARLGRVDAATPFRLGMRQSLNTGWGPRVERKGTGDPAGRLRRARRIAAWIAVAGAVELAFCAWKANHDVSTPHALLADVSYARLIDPRIPLAHAVRVSGVVADRARIWTHDYTVRQDSHRDVYYALRAVTGDRAAPVSLIELDQTSPSYPVASWNMVDAPGPREGVPAVLDDWTAGQLRRAGIPLATYVIVLTRRQLHGRDPRPDPLDDGLYGMFGFVALFMGAILWWACRRAASKLGSGAIDARSGRRTAGRDSGG